MTTSNSLGSPVTAQSTDKNEFVWQLVSAAWAIAGWLAWLVAVAGMRWETNASSLTMLSGLIFSLGAGLRIASTTIFSSCSNMTVGVTALCGAIGNVSWLGYLVVCSQSASQAIPVVILFAVGELVAWKFLLNGSLSDWRMALVANRRWRWLGDIFTSGPSPDVRVAISAGTLSRESIGEEFPIDNSVEVLGAELSKDAVLAENHEIVRRFYEGVDEDQRRYLAGSVLTEFEPQQIAAEVVVGFCPAFNCDPDVELEVDHEQISARLVTCTPVGMRIQFRRPRSQERLTCMLDWYAIERSQDESEVSEELPSLP